MTNLEHYGWVWFVALAAVLVLALVWRGRRLIGHQRFSAQRIRVRAGVIAVLMVVVLFPQIRRETATAVRHGVPPQVVGQPIFHGLLFLVLGYYLVYYVGILLRARGIPPAPTASR